MTDLPLILIVDDEPALRELIGLTLGDRYRLREAATVDEALAAAAEEPPDALVLDLMVPGGGGLSLLRKLRQSTRLRDLPVVVVSAWSDEAHRLEAERERADAFLGKPFDPVELEQRVAELVARGRRGGSG